MCERADVVRILEGRALIRWYVARDGSARRSWTPRDATARHDRFRRRLRRLGDDVSEEEKWRRFRLLEELQEGIAAEISARYLGESVQVLFEEKVRGRWRGRTPTNKLVFVESN